jgi:hypothetical protein
MASRFELLKKYFGTEDRMEVVINFGQDFKTPPLEQLVKMPIPYTSDNHPPLPLVEDIKNSGPEARVRVMDGYGCVVKRSYSPVLF